MFDEKQEFVKVTAISLNSHCPVSLCCSEQSLCVAWTWRVGTLVVVFDKLVKYMIDYGCLLSRKIKRCPKIYSVDSISVWRLNFVKYHAKPKRKVTCNEPSHQIRPS